MEILKAKWKILLGFISVGPLLFFAFFFFWLVPAFFAPRAGGAPSLFSQRFDALLPWAMGTSVMLVLLLLLYGILLYRRTDMQTDEKFGVLLAILITNGIVLPFVWWLYIWRDSNMSRRAERHPTSTSRR